MAVCVWLLLSILYSFTDLLWCVRSDHEYRVPDCVSAQNAADVVSLPATANESPETAEFI